MVLTPTKETPEKTLENEGQYAVPHLSKPASYSIMIRLIQQYVKIDLLIWPWSFFRITNTWTWTLIYAVGIVNAKAIYTNLIL